MPRPLMAHQTSQHGIHPDADTDEATRHGMLQVVLDGIEGSDARENGTHKEHGLENLRRQRSWKQIAAIKTQFDFIFSSLPLFLLSYTFIQLT